MDSYAGWDPNNQIKVRVICTDPYHALFMRNMLIPAEKIHSEVDLEILNCSSINLKYFDEKLKTMNLDKGDLNENFGSALLRLAVQPLAFSRWKVLHLQRSSSCPIVRWLNAAQAMWRQSPPLALCARPLAV